MEVVGLPAVQPAISAGPGYAMILADGLTWLVALMLIVALLLLYYLPAIVAARRDHAQRVPILIVNTFLGWTLVGWALTLAWSASGAAGKSPYATLHGRHATSP